MTPLQTLARAALEAFLPETAGYGRKLRVSAPGWVRDLVQDAHDNMPPDAWRHGMIAQTLAMIVVDGEFADVNTLVDGSLRVLLDWVASDTTRANYVDEVLCEGAGADGFFVVLREAQRVERQAIYSLVVAALRALVPCAACGRVVTRDGAVPLLPAGAVCQACSDKAPAAPHNGGSFVL